VNSAIDLAAKDLLQYALERLDQAIDPVAYAYAILQETTTRPTTEKITTEVIEWNDTNVECNDNEDLTTCTRDDFLAQIKEEVIFQTLLHKRIHEKNERVFRLKHRNGRRLLVVLPPDVESESSFVDEAKKTGWVDAMLNTRKDFTECLPYLP